MSELINILFLGDIVGRPGRQAVFEYLDKVNNDLESLQDQDLNHIKPDFVIANVENASHGFGLTKKNHGDLSEGGIDIFTSGNHIWDKKEIFTYINESEKLVRPMNYPKTVPGVGFRVVQKKGIKIGVINLLGRVFMPDINSPWECLPKAIEEIKKETDIILLDFHAEATAEKMAAGYICDNSGMSACLGTHTHVPTADEKILKNGCAYVSDVGFCGASNGIIGMDIESSLKRLTTCLPERFDVAPMDVAEVNGVVVKVDTATGKAVDIKRIKYVTEFKKEKEVTEG